jgi:1-aminocyclopropane-1-carboxylate deaminase
MTPFDEFWATGLAPAVDSAEAEKLFDTSLMPLRSRCAPVTLPGCRPIWIKRDDELSFGASGSKVRKYASLAPALIAAGTTDAVVLGARNSNNVLAAAQLLAEAGIRCHLVLRAAADSRLPDTVFDLVRQLVPDERITHVPRHEWDRHAELARGLLAETGGTGAIIPEGGSRLESIPGAMTLGLDICRNEQAVGREFADIFVEAGTGLSAIGLALGLAAAAPRRRTLHVLCTAVSCTDFLALYRRWTMAVGDRAPHVMAHETSSGPPPLPAATMADITAASRATGVLFEPHYSGRLLPVVARMLATGAAGPDSLLVHTGGMGLLSQLEWERWSAR